MTRTELARRIKDAALLRGEFTLRSGRKSKYYLDKYLFETQPEILRALGAMFAGYVKPSTTLIAGAELGGVAFLALMLVRRAGPSAPEGLEFPGIADHLPEVWDGWQRVVYEESVRSTEVVYAERGHRWIYKKDGLRLQVDLYYTYDHWHPFEACYRGVGWVIDEPRGDRFEAAGVEYPMVWFNGSLEGELHGQVAYSLFDPWRRETPVLMKSFAGAWSFLDQFRSRWNSLSTPAAAAGLVIILTEGGGTVTRGELSQVLRDRLSRAHERLFAGGGER